MAVSSSTDAAPAAATTAALPLATGSSEGNAHPNANAGAGKATKDGEVGASAGAATANSTAETAVNRDHFVAAPSDPTQASWQPVSWRQELWLSAVRGENPEAVAARHARHTQPRRFNYVGLLRQSPHSAGAHQMLQFAGRGAALLTEQGREQRAQQLWRWGCEASQTARPSPPAAAAWRQLGYPAAAVEETAAFAALAGDVDRVKSLCDSGFRDRCGAGTDTMLGVAVHMGHAPVVAYLLHAGACAEQGDLVNRAVLSHTATPDLVAMLVDAGAPQTLAGAIAVGDLEAVEAQLEQAGESVWDGRGTKANGSVPGVPATPLQLACLWGQPHVARWLLSHRGAWPAATAQPGQPTPLQCAAMCVANKDIRKELLAALQNAPHRAALDPIAAAALGDVDALRVALADCRSGRGGVRRLLAETAGGLTALHVAAHLGHLDAVHSLLRSGADVTTTTTEGFMAPGFTAMELARIAGHRHVVAALVAHTEQVLNRCTNPDRRDALNWCLSRFHRQPWRLQVGVPSSARAQEQVLPPLASYPNLLGVARQHLSPPPLAEQAQRQLWGQRRLAARPTTGGSWMDAFNTADRPEPLLTHGFYLHEQAVSGDLMAVAQQLTSPSRSLLARTGPTAQPWFPLGSTPLECAHLAGQAQVVGLLAEPTLNDHRQQVQQQENTWELLSQLAQLTTPEGQARHEHHQAQKRALRVALVQRLADEEQARRWAPLTVHEDRQRMRRDRHRLGMLEEQERHFRVTADDQRPSWGPGVELALDHELSAQRRASTRRRVLAEAAEELALAHGRHVSGDALAAIAKAAGVAAPPPPPPPPPLPAPPSEPDSDLDLDLVLDPEAESTPEIPARAKPPTGRAARRRRDLALSAGRAGRNRWLSRADRDYPRGWYSADPTEDARLHSELHGLLRSQARDRRKLRRWLNNHAGAVAHARKRGFAGAMGPTPLHLAATWDKDVLALVGVCFRIPVEVQDGAGRTPLSLASTDGAARWLLQQGARVNHGDAWGQTPLLTAVAAGNGSLVEMLVDHGASVDTICAGAVHAVTDSEGPKLLSGTGQTPLSVAAVAGRSDLVDRLLSAGANPWGSGGAHAPRQLASSLVWDEAPDEAAHRAVASMLLQAEASVVARAVVRSIQAQRQPGWFKALEAELPKRAQAITGRARQRLREEEEATKAAATPSPAGSPRPVYPNLDPNADCLGGSWIGITGSRYE